MAEEIDWTLTTWEGSRRRQYREFLALSFREKLQALEDMVEVASALARSAPASGSRAAAGEAGVPPL